MKSSSPNQDQQSFLYQGLKEILNPKEPLYQLAEKIPWETIDQALTKYYVDFGRPAKPIRLMVSLMLLKQMYNLGDETVIAHWVQNPYWQYFSGEKIFQWKFPLEPSDMKKNRRKRDKKDTGDIDSSTWQRSDGKRSGCRYDSTRKEYHISNRCKTAQKNN